MKYLSLSILASALFTTAAIAADAQKPVLNAEIAAEVTVNTQTFPADPNARMAAPTAPQVALPPCPKLPAPIFTAKGKYAENVCFSEPSLGGKVTNLGANKIVYFNALPAAKTYVFTGTATGHGSKTATLVVPANTIASACMNGKFNAAKGINYNFNFALGMSPPPAGFCP
jgi:hypothetical protein